MIKNPFTAMGMRARIAKDFDETGLGAVADTVAARLAGKPATVVEIELADALSDMRVALSVAAGARPLRPAICDGIISCAETLIRARIAKGEH